jgi:hypothetical protein
VANHFREEAGLFAATVMGIALANQRRAPVRHVVEFQEAIGVLLIGSIFIVLGARVQWEAIESNILPGLGVVLVLVVVARPAAVAASTIRSTLSRSERLYLGGIAPRGIVAASVSALFGLKLEDAGVEGGGDLAALTFVVVAFTVIIYGLGAAPLARRLRLTVPDPTGVALIGAAPWVVSLGQCLQRVDVQVLVVTTDESEIRAAQSADLLVYNGRLAHKDLAETVEALGVGLALAVSDREELNAFASERFLHLLGRANVYGLPRSAEERTESHGGAGGGEVRELGDGLTSVDLAALVESGAGVETVRADDQDALGEGFWPIVTARNGRAVVVQGDIAADAGWVIGLRAPAEVTAAGKVDRSQD